MDMFCFNKRLLFPILFVCSLIAENQPAFAAYPTYSQNVYESAGNQWLLGASAGGASRSLQRSTTRVFNGTPIPAPYNQDTFSIKDPSSIPIVALFGGYQWSHLNKFLPYYSLALRYEHQFSSNIMGTVEQYGLPQFTNYKYSMGLNSSILNIVGKANLIQYKNLLPYISAGIGVAFNKVSNYKEQAIPPVSPPRINPGYASYTSTNFAYSLGAGVDIIYCNNWWVTLGYEYSNLGNIKSGQGAGLWSNTHLNFGTLETNTLFGSITYLFS